MRVVSRSWSRRRLLCVGLVPLLALAGLTAAAVAPSSWVPIGPSGGSLRDVRFVPTDPDVAWAAAESGLYRSTDGGAQWSLVPLPRTDSWIWWTGAVAVEPSPSLPERAWVFVSNPHRLLRTDDAGASWLQVMGPPSPRNPVELLVDPIRPDRLYAHGPSRLARSDDAGESWRPLPRTYDSVAVDAEGVLWAARSDRLLTSSTGGDAWRVVASLPFAYPRLYAEPRAADRLWALASEPPGSQLWKSRDGGRTWTRVGRPLPLATGLTIHPDRVNVMYLDVPESGRQSILASRDGGVTWRFLPRIEGDTHRLAPRPGRPNELLLAAGSEAGDDVGGMFASRDFGASLRRSERGITARRVFALAADPFDTNRLLVLDRQYSQSQYRRSTDGGTSWATHRLSPDLGWPVELAADPFVTGRAYLLTGQGVLLRSDDFGQTFRRLAAVDRPGTCQPIGGSFLAVDPTVRDRLFSGGFGGSLSVSTDGGTSWRGLFPHCDVDRVELWSWVQASPTDPQRLLALGFESFLSDEDYVFEARLFESDDGGASFAGPDATLPGALWSVAYDPADGVGLVGVFGEDAGGTSSALYRRQPDGSWTVIDASRRWWRLFVVPGGLVAAIQPAVDETATQLLWSADADHWEALDALPIFPLYGLSLVPGEDGDRTLFAATPNGAWRFLLGAP